MENKNVQSQETSGTVGKDILARMPSGLGTQIGLDPSIPAVRVWGIINFERTYSGNEASGINEAFTDVEPFLRPDGQLDARARIRATKFNYVRESFFRQRIRWIAERLLVELAAQVKSEGAEGSSEGQSTSPGTPSDGGAYLGVTDNVFQEYLEPVIVDPDRLPAWRIFFRALLAKMAVCSPASPCGACPACIAEGSAATTSAGGVSVPHNWEKKYRETDFKTFLTVNSAAQDLIVNVDSLTLEPALTEAVVRNRMPRAGDLDTAQSMTDASINVNRAVGGQMILREHMFRGRGFVKTTLFNPTRLEVGMLAYEHLVTDVRRGAKTSSGAGVWSIDETKPGREPLLVVDEILSLDGFVQKPPLPSVPTDVESNDAGIRRCFFDPLEIAEDSETISKVQYYYRNGSEKETSFDRKQENVSKASPEGVSTTSSTDGLVLVRYVGWAAWERLKLYLRELEPLEPATEEERLRSFTALAQYCASVVARLIRPRAAIQAVLQELNTARNSLPPTLPSIDDAGGAGQTAPASLPPRGGAGRPGRRSRSG